MHVRKSLEVRKENLRRSVEQIELHKEKVVQAEQEAETQKLIQEQKKKDAKLRLLEIIDDYKTKKRKWTSCYREVLSLGLWDEPNWQETYEHHKSQMENVFNEYIFEKQGRFTGIWMFD